MKTIIRTLKINLKHLTKEEYLILRDFCHYSKNLYNYGLYQVRQYFFENDDYLDYKRNYHICKNNENYKLLNSCCSQQTLKTVDEAFKSFFALIKLKKDNKLPAGLKLKIPRYKSKDELLTFSFLGNSLSITDNKIKIPMSREYKKQCDTDVFLTIPEYIKNKHIKQVSIVPKYNGQYFEAHFTYEDEVEINETLNDNILAIDPGVNNLASCISTTGASFIIDGRKIKSINQYWNKRKAQIQSQLDIQFSKKKSKFLNIITRKRNNQIEDYIRKSARKIINFCLESKISTVVVGRNKHQKLGVEMGKVNNQNFVQIPHQKLRQKISDLCSRYNINYIEQEESYTSKASALDLDILPVYNINDKTEYRFSGKRVKRGLYKTLKGFLVNADINGAFNILRKSIRNIENIFDGLCRGLLVSPLRIKIS